MPPRFLRPLTLYGRLALTFVVLLLGFGFLCTLLSAKFVLRSEAQLIQVKHAGLAGKIASRLLRLNEEGRGYDAIFDYVRQIDDLLPGINIYLLADDGKIEQDLSTNPIGRLPEAIDIGPIQDALRADARTPGNWLIEHPAAHGVFVPFSSARVALSGTDYYLLVILRSWNDEVGFRFLREQGGAMALAASFLVLAFGGVALALISLRFVTRRFSRLVSVVHSFADGDLSARISDSRSDEIGWLGRTLDQMASKLSSTLAELRGRDELRRKLIADVSHDLRGPLNVIGCALEAADRDRDRGVAITAEALLPIRKNSEKLKGLLQELFELSALEARDRPLDLAPTDLTELLMLIAERFQPLAEQGQLDLRTELPAGQVNADADVVLLDRALSNLVENAVRHTAPGGTIVLSLTESEKGATLMVRDTGTGISSEDMSRIFERSFSSSPDATHNGAGLGLAIVKKIVEAHGSIVEVTSTQGAGTRFWFTLLR